MTAPHREIQGRTIQHLVSRAIHFVTLFSCQDCPSSPDSSLATPVLIHQGLVYSSFQFPVCRHFDDVSPFITFNRLIQSTCMELRT